MSAHPNFIDLRSKSHDTMQSETPSLRGLPSPRVNHVTGDIAKTLSPLDAFRAHTELLARQLNDSKNGGRRISRLPPVAVANSLAMIGPRYAPSSSPNVGRADSGRNTPPRDDGEQGNTPELENLEFRPQSHYVRMSGMTWGLEVPRSRPSPNDQVFVTPAESRPPHTGDYFSSARTASPEPLVNGRRGLEDGKRPTPPLNLQRSFDSGNRGEDTPHGQPATSGSQKSYDSSTLAPPMSPMFRHGGSIRSITVDSSDDDLSGSTGGSSFSQQRKLSSCSGVSMPHSPLPQPYARSPSINSEYSAGGTLVRPAYNNFSRPLSRSSRPSIEPASRQPSFDSRPSLDSISRRPSSDSQRRVLADGPAHTQVNLEPEQFHESKEYQPAAAPSYVYAKYSLPRGRLLLRDSVGPDKEIIHKLNWDQASLSPNANAGTSSTEAETSPNSSPPSTSHSSVKTAPSSDSPSTEQNQLTQPRPPPTPISDHKPTQSSSSMRSASTIKARSQRTIVPSKEVTAEEHLAKGVALHEGGSLKESTYHLRIAARSGLPTAMLLYALACRHGWGMRPNQQEGVQWLRKAADSASLEIADDEDPANEKDGVATDPLERKTRRAQFALSIYELGVSHMKGWGIEQDKALALRCFEIAGNWGDADAMAEAGYCYAEGTGCKKNLKKAAKYYRMAEAKGISMVGNSWIYKPKYADEVNDRPTRSLTAKSTASDKTSRDKSRTRTLFGRKKSVGAKVS